MQHGMASWRCIVSKCSLLASLEMVFVRDKVASFRGSSRFVYFAGKSLRLCFSKNAVKIRVLRMIASFAQPQCRLATNAFPNLRRAQFLWGQTHRSNFVYECWTNFPPPAMDGSMCPWSCLCCTPIRRVRLLSKLIGRRLTSSTTTGVIC